MSRLRGLVRRHLIGIVALFVALSGTAYAAATLTGRDIKDGSIYSVDIAKSTRNALAGQTGPAGRGGNAGPRGAKGDVGAAGVTGAAGASGRQGETGGSGPQGARGDAGVAGARGDTGAGGARGADGERGPTGAAGSAGDAGEQGADGAAGPTGPTGADGPEGPQGDTGPTGADGPAGAGTDHFGLIDYSGPDGTVSFAKGVASAGYNGGGSYWDITLTGTPDVSDCTVAAQTRGAGYAIGEGRADGRVFVYPYDSDGSHAATPITFQVFCA